MRKSLPSLWIGASAPSRFARVLILSFLILFYTNDTFAQARMIKDVTELEDVWNSEYGQMVTANGYFYFVTKSELWKSNGTVEGSVRLKSFRWITNLRMSGSTLFFLADDGVSGSELWKSNGTTTSTVRVKDIYAGTASSEPADLTDVNGILYFTAIAPGLGRELWKSNGTAAGTVLVKDIMGKSGTSNPSFLTNLNGTLFFAANDGARGYELWKTNGTAEGTVLVRDIRTAAKISSSPEQLRAAGGLLYFIANDGVSGKELWRSDGTAEGTIRLKDIMPGSGSPLVENLTAVQNTLFFTANDGVHGHELWKTTGTPESTVLVKDMTPGREGSHAEWYFGARMGSFRNVNGTLFYTAYHGADYYIWKSDGTEAGTVPLHPAGGPGISQPRAQFTYVNGVVYYFNDEHGNSDTYALCRMNPDGSNPQTLYAFALHDPYNPYYPGITSLGSMVYVVARRGLYSGFSITRSDGTPEGTIEFIDPYKATIGSDPANMVTFKGKTYFETTVTEYLSEYPYYEFAQDAVWRTDGTEAGTERLFEGSKIKTVISNDRLFIATDQGDLWKVDGTGAVTHVKLIRGEIVKLVNANGNVFFYTREGEVWRSNGTATGTVLLKTGHVVTSFNTIGSSLIYHIISGEGEELWKSNGSSAGTVRIKAIRYGIGATARVYPSAKLNNIVYFVANDGIHGNEIWRTDGTEAGTYMALDINGNDQRESDHNEYDISQLHVFQNTLYMSVRQIIYSEPGALASDKWELRSYPGSGSGTAVIGEISPATSMMSDASTLYMVAADPDLTLWLSAYKPSQNAAIEKVHDLGHAYNVGRGPDYAFVNGEMYFSMQMGSLWRTNGTACGTVQIPTGSYVAYPIELLGNDLIMGASTGDFGIEPHIFSLNDAPPSTSCGSLARTVETQDQATELMVSGYPNPFTEHVKVRLNSAEIEPMKVSVFTIEGLPVEEIAELETGAEYTIGAAWKPGWYILRVATKDRIFTEKIKKD